MNMPCEDKLKICFRMENQASLGQAFQEFMKLGESHVIALKKTLFPCVSECAQQITDTSRANDMKPVRSVMFLSLIQFSQCDMGIN